MTVTALHPSGPPEADSPPGTVPEANTEADTTPDTSTAEAGTPPAAAAGHRPLDLPSQHLGHLEHVDPNTLILEPNVRSRVTLSKAFVASVKDLGVLVPVTAHRTADGELRVIYGQRRTLAAVEAGLPLVGVVVIDVPDAERAREIARLITQLAENDDRDPVEESDRIAAVEQLSLLGLSARTIAKRTHRPIKDTEKRLAVAGNPLAAAALERFDLTLEQGAVLTEFADDTGAVKELTVAAKKDPGHFDHIAEQLRARRAMAAAREAATAQLAEAGVAVVDQPEYGQRTLHRLDRLRSATTTETDPTPLTTAEHAGCPGHAAYLQDHHPFQGDSEVRTVFVCTDWQRHGHQELMPATITGLGAAGGQMSEQERAERRTVIANNKAWVPAQTVRRRWLTTFLARRSAPKDAPQWIAATLATSTHDVRRAMEHGHPMALKLLGLATTGTADTGSGAERPWSPYSGTPHPIATAAATAAPARAGVLTLALLLGGIEAGVDRNCWRRASDTQVSYFSALQRWGYQLSDVEQLVLQQAAGAGDTEDTEDACGDEADNRTGDGESTDPAEDGEPGAARTEMPTGEDTAADSGDGADQDHGSGDQPDAGRAA